MGKKVIALILALVLPVFCWRAAARRRGNVRREQECHQGGLCRAALRRVGPGWRVVLQRALMAFNERKAELEEKSGCTLEFVTNDDQSDRQSP